MPWWGCLRPRVLVLTTAHHLGVSEPFKQWLAEQTGMVDASGKRRRMTMALGLSIQAQDASASAPAGPLHGAPPSSEHAPSVQPGDWRQTLIWSALMFWRAGGSATPSAQV